MLKYLPIPHWRWHAQLVPRARSPQRLSFSTRCRDPPRGGPPDLDSCRFCSTYGESTIKRRECCTEHNQRLIHIDRLTNRLAVLQVFPKKSYIIVSAATWKKSCIMFLIPLAPLKVSQCEIQGKRKSVALKCAPQNHIFTRVCN